MFFEKCSETKQKQDQGFWLLQLELPWSPAPPPHCCCCCVATRALVPWGDRLRRRVRLVLRSRGSVCAQYGVVVLLCLLRTLACGVVGITSKSNRAQLPKEMSNRGITHSSSSGSNLCLHGRPQPGSSCDCSSRHRLLYLCSKRQQQQQRIACFACFCHLTNHDIHDTLIAPLPR